MGNLALGRVLSTQSVCGSNFSEHFCFYKQTASPGLKGGCSAAKCSKCNSAVPSRAHPPSAMSDSSFRHPDTWWQSAEGVKEETLRLDLETEFLFTHLIVVFRSPRPAAMVLERSQDRGRTWETLRYFARDCQGMFGLAEGSTCTSKYSGAFPCSRGEVSSVHVQYALMDRETSHLCFAHKLPMLLILSIREKQHWRKGPSHFRGLRVAT